MVYALSLPQTFKQFHIAQLEMLNIVFALKVWSNIWTNKRILIQCDNQAEVEVLNSGSTKDMFLANCASNIWLITVLFNIHLKVIHVPFKHNRLQICFLGGLLLINLSKN